MSLKLHRIKYAELSSRQKENYNFQKISGILADYGYQTIRLTDDWNGADFIAQHVSGNVILRIQLKGRMGFHHKYQGKDIWICFRDQYTSRWFLYPHDNVFRMIKRFMTKRESEVWRSGKGYSFPRLSEDHRRILEPYRVRAESRVSRFKLIKRRAGQRHKPADIYSTVIVKGGS